MGSANKPLLPREFRAWLRELLDGWAQGEDEIPSHHNQHAALTDYQCRHASCGDQEIKKLPDGDGLYLWVYADGKKYWRFRYWLGGKEQSLSLGVYPQISLKEARARRDIERNCLNSGLDPSVERVNLKLLAEEAKSRLRIGAQKSPKLQPKYKIDDGIPLRSIRRKRLSGSGDSKWNSYPWSEMKIGQSFLIPGEKKTGNVCWMAATAGKKYQMKFTARKVRGGCRLWRIA
ncbi:MAG: Arm DNA-binding domain-containing protein [Pseudomonadota bacterium]|nr:Arm DNA-binding domain-containing protein [Pseudomonadota bacterium]